MLPKHMSLPFITTPDNLETRFLPPPGWTVERLDVAPDSYLRVGHVQPEKPAIGTILLLQGMAQTMEDYYETIRDFLTQGYAVASFDWYGQGASTRARAHRFHVTDTDIYTRHLGQVLAMDLVAALPRPLHVVAHSMGGLLFLNAACTTGVALPPIASATLIAPFLGMPVIDTWLKPAARLFLDICTQLNPTGYPLSSLCHDWRESDRIGLAVTRYTSDPVRGSLHNAWRLANPVLQTGGATAQCLTVMHDTMLRLRQPDRLAQLTIPTLLLRAGDDKIVHNGPLTYFCGNGQLDCRTIPGSAHEILHERDDIRNMALEHILQWVHTGYLTKPAARDTPLPASNLAPAT